MGEHAGIGFATGFFGVDLTFGATTGFVTAARPARRILVPRYGETSTGRPSWS
jgi:hypothetical protein